MKPYRENRLLLKRIRICRSNKEWEFIKKLQNYINYNFSSEHYRPSHCDYFYVQHRSIFVHR